MAKAMQLRRLVWMAGLLALAFAGLGYRLVELQVLRHDEFSAQAQRDTRHQFLLEPRRGDILDAKGNLLATSELVKTVCANPVFIGNHQAEVARALAPLLQESETNLAQRLGLRTHRNEKGQIVTNLFVELKRKVKPETWEKVRETMAQLSLGMNWTNLTRTQKKFYHNLRTKAIFARNDQLRVYPNQSLAAHVLGYASSKPRVVDDCPVYETVGQDGIERVFDSQLAGVRGWRLTETDLLRHELVQWREQDIEPRDGLNVVLTIDSVIQQFLETALAEGMEKHTPISISGIVVRPRTGEILAMATLPTYNPNNPGAVAVEAWRNRVIADVAEPGSAFKIVVVSGALNEGVVGLSDAFDCEHGVFYYAGRPLHDHGQSYGMLTVEEIITKSSNIGAAKIGIKLGGERLYDYIQRFGFGVATGLPLPGEVSARSFVHPVKEWSKVSIARIPMGQGISVTRLQMTMALCAIANQGLLLRPMLVDRLEDRDHNVVAKYSPQRVRQVLSPAAARMMVTALKTVVSPEGTAPKAALEHYTVAGKTGTGQKVEHGVYVDKYFSSFLGFFPADGPELCISIMMDEPKNGHLGGQAAAPVFKQVAERAGNYLGLPPDRLAEPGLTEGQGLKTAATLGQNQFPK